MEGSFTATELSKLCFAALASKVQCGELCPRIPEVMAEIRRRVEKRFLVTSWCPTLPGLAVAIPLPRRLEREGSNHNIGEVEAPPHPNKRARSIKRIAYKLWLIRTVDLQRVAWHSGGLDPDANLFERVDTLKFLVNLDEIGDESLPNPSDLMEPCEIKFDWYKKGAVSGLKVAWHPTVLEVYLVYSPKVTTVLEVKKALSTGRGSVKVNPAECPAPLRVGTGIGSTPGPKRAPAVPTFYSVGVSVENGTLSLSTINSLACTLHPASTKSGLTLPLSLHWVSGAASYSKALLAGDYTLDLGFGPPTPMVLHTFRPPFMGFGERQVNQVTGTLFQPISAPF
ncbi:hypothetical protein L0F63_004620 [Massospora cicadina]|nr:hypothetical protein L0F63_004620 [Massospora cicadina]